MNLFNQGLSHEGKELHAAAPFQLAPLQENITILFLRQPFSVRKNHKSSAGVVVILKLRRFGKKTERFIVGLQDFSGMVPKYIMLRMLTI